MVSSTIVRKDARFSRSAGSYAGEVSSASPAVLLTSLSGDKGRNRVVVEGVSPQIDSGRHPIRRIVGDSITVSASIFADGHDQLNSRLLYRHESDNDWRIYPMECGAKRPHSDPDRWAGIFLIDKIGLWTYTVEGWIDRFATWASDLKKTFDSQASVVNNAADLLWRELPIKLRFGAGLIEGISQRASDADAKRMLDISRFLNSLADDGSRLHGYPLDEDAELLLSQYPDLTFATRFEPELHIEVDRELAGFSAWYELFPRSTSSIPGQHGTFGDVERQLPEIAEMGFDIVYLPPIHPIGRTHRKGKNNSPIKAKGDPGSPWAVGDRAAGAVASGTVESERGGHKSIHPEFGDFESFDHLVASAKTLGLELALDIAFQCSPDHPWVTDHPQWFHLRPDGSIQCAVNPPKIYQDIFPLNFESEDWRALWIELYSVFEFWIQHGVRVFRVDNPHTKALPFWEWCLGHLRRNYPDILLLAEAFTKPSVMYELAKIGFGQSYTYFTWRNTSAELKSYLEEITRSPISEFFRPNFWPSTPDILPRSLQEGGPPAFKQRLVLAATLSSNYGIYGPSYELCENAPTTPASGKLESEEYLDSEKYEIRQRDRNAAGSLVPLIRTLNQIRRNNRALQSNHSLHFHGVDNDNLLCYSKTTPDFANTILVLVNLDAKTPQVGSIELDLEHLGILPNASFVVEELLTGEHDIWHGGRVMDTLQPDLRPANIYRISHPHLCSAMQLGSAAAVLDAHPPVFWREEE